MNNLQIHCCFVQLTVKSASSKNLADTEIKASSGHSWNQLILVQLVKAGNFLLRMRRVAPTGEKHKTTYKNNISNLLLFNVQTP